MTSLPRPFTKQPALNGFSLIEMAIILVIIGLIAGTITPLLVSQIKQEKVSAGRDIVRLARDEIIGYFQSNGHLPANGTDYAFPAGLGHGSDPWTKQIFYKPLSNAADQNFDICNTSLDLDTDGLAIDVPNQSSTLKNIAFVVGSEGENYTRDTVLTDSPIEIQSYDPDSYDDIVEYITLNHLQNRIDCSVEGGGGGGDAGDADISFENNISDFSHIIESVKGLINVDLDNKKITMGGSQDTESGCVWYGKNADPCSNGVCDFGSGFRAYFEFKTTEADESENSEEYASGFTFAITSDTNSDRDTVCGGYGAHLGYAGSHPNAPSGWQYFIGSPKSGIEFDFFPSNSKNMDCYDKDDTEQNHVAGIFWGKYSRNNPGTNLCDDNRHGAGNFGSHNSKNPQSSQNDGYTYINDNTTWLENTESHQVRVDAFHDAQNKNVHLKTWIDKTGSENINSTMSVDPDVEHQLTISPDEFAQLMETIRFGWTVGSSDNQEIEISNFKINFLDT